MGRPAESGMPRRIRPVPSPEALYSSSLCRSSPDASSSASKSPAVARLIRVLGDAQAGRRLWPYSADSINLLDAVSPLPLTSFVERWCRPLPTAVGVGRYG